MNTHTLVIYTLTLLDPLFYAREGLYGAYTPPLLHGTAINLAVACAVNHEPAKQPLVIAESNGGRNIPRYKNSWEERPFYFTPAALISPLRYFPEITKGEKDGFLIPADPGSELFRAMTLNYLSPDSVFEGFALYPISFKTPTLIRLGSFRGKAELSYKEIKPIKMDNNKIASHQVDPLISKVTRGVARNVFPYPVIENALVQDVVKVHCPPRKETFIAFPKDLMGNIFHEETRSPTEPLVV